VPKVSQSDSSLRHSVCLFYFVDGYRYFTVDFLSSSSIAVLRFYPALAEVPSVSSVCLRFTVYTSSAAVELLVDVRDMSKDITDIMMGGITWFHRVNSRQPVGTGNRSITVLRGQQYIVFTARKIKLNGIPDRVYIKDIRYEDESCSSDSNRK